MQRPEQKGEMIALVLLGPEKKCPDRLEDVRSAMEINEYLGQAANLATRAVRCR